MIHKSVVAQTKQNPREKGHREIGRRGKDLTVKRTSTRPYRKNHGRPNLEDERRVRGKRNTNQNEETKQPHVEDPRRIMDPRFGKY